jgi:hypothetical protein
MSEETIGTPDARYSNIFIGDIQRAVSCPASPMETLSW